MKRARLLKQLVLLAAALALHGSCNAAKPQRIASLNLCTDQILLMLVAPERIASVTHLAAAPSYSYTWREAAGIHQNSGLAEQVIPLQPDLILASPYSPGSAVKLLEALHFPVEIIDIPQNLTGVEQFVLRMGELVGEPERAAAVIQTMRHKIATAQQHHDQPPASALAYAPNGHTAGTHTLKHDILRSAGFVNLAAELGIEYYGNLSIEQLLLAKPDVVVIDDSSSNQDSLAQRYTNHPALQKAIGNSRLVAIDSNQWLCAGPMAADAILTLAQVRR